MIRTVYIDKPRTGTGCHACNPIGQMPYYEIHISDDAHPEATRTLCLCVLCSIFLRNELHGLPQHPTVKGKVWAIGIRTGYPNVRRQAGDYGMVAGPWPALIDALKWKELPAMRADQAAFIIEFEGDSHRLIYKWGHRTQEWIRMATVVEGKKQ